MTYWMYGVGFVAVVGIIATLKSDQNTRMWIAAAVIAGMIYYAMGKKKR